MEWFKKPVAEGSKQKRRKKTPALSAIIKNPQKEKDRTGTAIRK